MFKRALPKVKRAKKIMGKAGLYKRQPKIIARAARYN
jgi:hypothetical protein